MILHRGTLLLVLLSLAISGACAGEEDAADLLLNPKAFEADIEKHTGPALVEFLVSSDQCKECLALIPSMKKVATNLKGIATVGTVDCMDPDSMKICRTYVAQAFPKVLVFKPGVKVNPYTGGHMKEYEVHKGPATPKVLAAAVTDTLNDELITKISSSSDHKTFVEKQPKLAKVLLFTDKPSSTVLYKGLSWAYQQRLLFGEVRPADNKEEGATLAEQYDVTDYPTLLLVKPDGSRERYNGALKAAPLREFLDGFAAKEAAPDAAQGSQPGGAGGPDSPQDPDTVVVHTLAAANLTDIEDKDDMWLVAFYSAAGDKTCKPQVEQLHKLLQEVQGIVSYGSVNTAAAGVTANSLKAYGVDVDALEADGCALQLVLFPYGNDKSETLRWSGGLDDDAKALQNWILGQVPDMTSLLGSELEANAFVKAAAPGSAAADTDKAAATTAKVFLFSTKQEVPGIYKALAMHFQGKARVLFAWVSPDKAGPGPTLMQKMHVRKAPGMAMLLPAMPRPGGPAPNEGDMMIQPYFGPMKFQKMLAWLTAITHLAGVAQDSPFDASAQASPSRASDSTGPSEDDLDIRSQQQLQSACYDKAGLCMLVLLDGSSQDAGKHISTTKKVAAALASSPVHWVAVDVSKQGRFRRAFGFEGLDQLPAMVALSSRRMRFAQAASPFSEGSAKQLVDKVLMGTAVTVPLQELPGLVDGGEEEEVEEAPAVIEEFDLTEIMSEEVTVNIPSKEELLLQADKELEEEQQRKLQQEKSKKSKSKKSKKSKKKKGKKTSKKSKKDEL